MYNIFYIIDCKFLFTLFQFTLNKIYIQETISIFFNSKDYKIEY